MAKIIQAYDVNEQIITLPPTPITETRNPTTADRNYVIGTLWVNTSTASTFCLSKLTQSAATWNAVSASIATSTVVNPTVNGTINSRMGQLVMTGNTTAAAGTLTTVITNSFSTATSYILATAANTNAAAEASRMTIIQVKPTAGSFTVVMVNDGADALDAGSTVYVNFWVLN